MEALGIVRETPRLAAIQAEGANPFYSLWKSGGDTLTHIKPETVASAIKIGNPVSWRKALKAIHATRGLVEQVSDQEIMDAKAVVDRSGVGCEPASAASVAGAKKLVEVGVIDPSDDVVCILTGSLLKDPDLTVRYHTGVMEDVRPRFANRPTVIEPDLSSVEEALSELALARIVSG